MNRTVRAILGVIFVLVICFSAITICQNVGKSVKLDVTQEKLYTLSGGTKAILSKLQQPIKMKLYYAETAAKEGPDKIRYYNNYYQFVRSLLEEYVANSNGMIELEVIDPRPYSEDETNAIRYGLQRFNITEEESFFFGLVLQTQFGVEKSIAFFAPNRQNFIEYDISNLIDTAITRQKTRLGVLSSLDVMGDSQYMMQMKAAQGQQDQIKREWGIIGLLKQKYDVKQIQTDAEKIEDVDILLVIHPKDLAEKTLFAIDQFVLKGGKTIVCVDPYCVADESGQMAMQMRQMPKQDSNLEPLMAAWGLKMEENTFAGDRELAMVTSLSAGQRPQKLIGLLGLNHDCFSADEIITSDLSDVKVLFAGVLEKTDAYTDAENEGDDRSDKPVYRPLIETTDRGNSWKVGSPFELMRPDATRMMQSFTEGTEPVVMGYLVEGRFKSAFPDGIEIEEPDESGEDDNAEPKVRKVTGLTEATEDCAVVVFSDVDFISDLGGLAFQQSFFGRMVVGDNSALMQNAVEGISGSSDLISIRSRGNFKRPFTVVDEIEAKAEKETEAEVERINAEIQGFENELQQILATANKDESGVIGSTILKKKQETDYKIAEAKARRNQIQLKRRQSIDKLGNKLRNINMLAAPAVILVIAIVLGIARNMRKRQYISHKSDS